ncbi:GDP-mannose 4,6-dehydratase [Candidatus Woesearchaeota archaeon]|nr:GDP-mannose 4,6-dehydratase [Candidatus Woesearchaeota archaeon]
MKVLVTGGAGFIGSHIVDLLLNKGNNVVIIDNLSTGKKGYINPKAKFYEADITDTEQISRIFKKEKPDYVIHTAAQVMLRKSLEDPIEDAKINIIGTLNILEACRNNNVKKIIYTSTGGARVGEPEYLPVDEKHPLNPCSPYGISKHTAEHYVWMYHKLYNLDYLIFCFGNVYGPRDDPETKRVIAVFATKMLKGESPEIFGDGKQTRDFIYVLDLAEFIVNSMEKNPEHKLFHLANGKQISVNEIFEILKKHSGFKGEAKHTEAIKGEVRDIVLDTTLAQKELGWNPKHSFEEGLKRTFEWFKRQK